MAAVMQRAGWRGAAVLCLGAAFAVGGRSPGRTPTGRDPCGAVQSKPLPGLSYDLPYVGRQPPVKGRSPDWLITLTGRQKYAPRISCEGFVFSLKSERNGTASQFTICTAALQVDEIDVINSSRALILGRLGANFPTAEVVDLPSGRVLDEFWCFMPVISPGHRFLAFLKSFPGHPGPVAVEAEYLVYDLKRSAAYNREHLRTGVTYDAGWPVYPPGATNAEVENLKPGMDSPVH